RRRSAAEGKALGIKRLDAGRVEADPAVPERLADRAGLEPQLRQREVVAERIGGGRGGGRGNEVEKKGDPRDRYQHTGGAFARRRSSSVAPETRKGRRTGKRAEHRQDDHQPPLERAA